MQLTDYENFPSVLPIIFEENFLYPFMISPLFVTNDEDIKAVEYAINNNIELIEYLPDYKRYGRGAPLVRNSDIIKNSDFVLALWDGKSRGTKDSPNKARKMNKTTKIIYL